jgi:hypothetical protein
MKTQPDQNLKEKLEAAVARAIAVSGADKFSKGALVERFLNKGVSRATLFRWIDASIASGRPGQAAVRAVKKAAAKRIEHPPRRHRARRSTEEMVEEMTEHLPAVVRLEEVSGTPTVKIIEELGTVIADLKAIAAHAKMPDGKPRNAKLLMAASDRIRACLETAMKIHAAMRDVDQVDRLHAAMIAEIAKESPAVAERVVRAMRAVAAQWSG